MTSGCTSCWVMASTCFCCKWHIKSPISTKRCCTSGWVSVDNVPAAVAPAPAETPMPTPAPSSVMRPALPPSAATSTDAPPSGEASMPIELGETQETPITTGGRSRLGGCALGAISGEVNFERTVEAAEVSAGPSNGDPLLLKVDDTAASTSENGSNSSNDPVMPILLAPGDAKAPTPPPSLTTEATTFRPKRWSSSSSSSSSSEMEPSSFSLMPNMQISPWSPWSKDESIDKPAAPRETRLLLSSAGDASWASGLRDRECVPLDAEPKDMLLLRDHSGGGVIHIPLRSSTSSVLNAGSSGGIDAESPVLLAAAAPGAGDDTADWDTEGIAAALVEATEGGEAQEAVTACLPPADTNEGSG
mmetsp:Transcript_35263/g.88852  ORF Transcript_35263/g.88852 Transcript_35263/m.88852 type:complete len:361 (-) Transcript_35263:1482-2564(-)